MYKKLESFIENNIDNWQDLLKKSPYNLKSVKKVLNCNIILREN